MSGIPRSVDGRPPGQGAVAFETFNIEGILNITDQAGGGMCVQALSGKSAPGQEEPVGHGESLTAFGGCISMSEPPISLASTCPSLRSQGPFPL